MQNTAAVLINQYSCAEINSKIINCNKCGIVHVISRDYRIANNVTSVYFVSMYFVYNCKLLSGNALYEHD